MYAHLITLKQIDQNRLSFPQVIDPDVRVNVEGSGFFGPFVLRGLF